MYVNSTGFKGVVHSVGEAFGKNNLYFPITFLEVFGIVGYTSLASVDFFQQFKAKPLF